MYVVDLEIADDGLVARASATVDGFEENDRSHSQRDEGEEGVVVAGRPSLTADGFVESLADGWRGWPGVRRWRAMELGLDLDARHDGRGHVSLGVQLSSPRVHLSNDDFWSARIVLTFEAGAELDQVAADLTSFMRP